MTKPKLQPFLPRSLRGGVSLPVQYVQLGDARAQLSPGGCGAVLLLALGRGQGLQASELEGGGGGGGVGPAPPHHGVAGGGRGEEGGGGVVQAGRPYLVGEDQGPGEEEQGDVVDRHLGEGVGGGRAMAGGRTLSSILIHL